MSELKQPIHIDSLLYTRQYIKCWEVKENSHQYLLLKDEQPLSLNMSNIRHVAPKGVTSQIFMRF